MEYQVPQFIEVEDKIFGPLTLKQFIFLAGSIGLAVILVLNLPFIFAILLSIPIVAFGAALAFFKVNGKPFISILESAFNYYIGKRLYLWRREAVAPEAPTAPTLPEAPVLPSANRELSRRKLEDLAWSLDVKEGTPPTT